MQNLSDGRSGGDGQTNCIVGDVQVVNKVIIFLSWINCSYMYHVKVSFCGKKL